MSDRQLSAELSAAAFLQTHWQRRPLVIRKMALTLPDGLDRNALFQHAADDRLGVRLVSGHTAHADSWQVSYGPPSDSDIKAQSDNDWTLLVQDLDKVRNDCAALLDQFDFLPRWRLDDVMASYAVPGGSVGPHVDQYDVFLIQLHGQRRWQWSAEFSDDWLPDVDLRILRDFSPQDEAVLSPGDALYLPPGIAHHGVAETECITLSVGLRAPSLGELLAGLAEYRSGDDAVRYTDPDLSLDEQNELSPAAIDRIRALLAQLSTTDDAALLDTFGRFITQYRLADDLLDWDEPPERWPDNARLQRHPAARLCWRRATDDPTDAQLFCHGEMARCSVSAAQLVCSNTSFTPAQLASVTDDHMQLLNWLAEHGALRSSS